jgi:hypothetical protein
VSRTARLNGPAVLQHTDIRGIATIAFSMERRESIEKRANYSLETEIEI